MKAFARLSEGVEMTLSELLHCARKRSVNSGKFIISLSQSGFVTQTEFALTDVWTKEIEAGEVRSRCEGGGEAIRSKLYRRVTLIECVRCTYFEGTN